MKKSMKVLGCSLLMAAAAAFPAFAEMPSQYSELVKSISDDFANGLPAYSQNTDDSEMSMYFANDHYATGDASGYAYALADLDGNGTEELLFVECSDYSIDDIWTIENDSLVHVAHGYARNAYYLTTDGQIVNQWSQGSRSCGTDYYQLQGSTLVKTRSVANPEYADYVIKGIPYTTFNGVPYFLNMTQEFKNIHVGDVADVQVDSGAWYKDLDDCYEVPVTYTQYYRPLRKIEQYDGYEGYEMKSNIRFAKDAKITYMDYNTGAKKTTTVSDFLRANEGHLPNAVFVNSYNSAGYVTAADWYSAG